MWSPGSLKPDPRLDSQHQQERGGQLWPIGKEMIASELMDV